MESKRRFGDRKDGRLIQSLAPFYKFMPYIMPTKNDACNQFEDCIEITNTDRWLRQKRLEGYKGLGYLHLFIAAYIRMVSLRPGINRFVAGRRIYARNNIEVVLTVRRSMSTTSNETTIKAVFAPTDTIFDVYRKMNEKIDEIKFGGEDNNTEQVAGALLKLPRFLLRFAVGCLRVMDYFGIIPQKLLDASPFHGSMIITDMGSLGIPPIYHHLYNFGTLPMFIAFGAKRKAVELDREGKAACYRVVQDLVGEFSRQNGSITCAELLHLKPEAVAKARAALSPRDATVKAPTDDGTPSYIPSERTQQYYKTRPCAAKVECAARIYAQHLCRKSHES